MLLTIAGVHVPVMPFKDVVGKTGAILPLQIGAMVVNVGIVFGVTVTFKVAVVAHWPVVGVKV